MGTNRYFSKFSVRNEQHLYDDLTIEAIQIFGIDIIYLPRKFKKLNPVYGEDVLNFFDDYYHIEVLIKSTNYENQNDFLSKFGLQNEAELTIEMSKTRFDQVTGKEMPEPLSGDLIYEPYTKSLWEIKYNTDNQRLPLLGDRNTFELSLMRYVFSQEDFVTGIKEIDNIEKDYAIKDLLYVNTSLGKFEDDEVIYQGSNFANNTASGKVVFFDDVENTILIKDVTGSFSIANNPIKSINSIITKNLLQEVDRKEDNKEFDISDNTEIEKNSVDDYLNFDENDVFGFLKNKS